ncbi:MAG: TIGR00282 family metallophosphoesterase [Fimbriimonadaceae bacterium]|nr:TIGR00282 family metallophosphoesterase [Fimbriimonadaceae bacterium]
MPEQAETYSILFLGDVVGRPGRQAVMKRLPSLQAEHRPLFTIVNGENAASGVGITSDIARDLLRSGVDAITLGNHWARKPDIFSLLNSDAAIVRPANLSSGLPGRGWVVLEKEGVRLTVLNLMGRVHMDPCDDPFRWFNDHESEWKDGHLLIDFHAEVTSEKVALGWHVDGRAAAVIGTHTHVATNDARVLPGGTAVLTDVGMCGPLNSILGMNKDVILRRFLGGLPERFEVAEGPSVISGAVIRVQTSVGRATGIEVIRLQDES